MAIKNGFAKNDIPAKAGISKSLTNGRYKVTPMAGVGHNEGRKSITEETFT